MKALLTLVFFAALLSGCPDSSKLPKVPPQVPEPKTTAPLLPGTGAIAPIKAPISAANISGTS